MHYTNIILYDSSLYHHFTDEQTGAQKCSLLPEPQLEIQLELEPEPLTLTAVLFGAKRGLMVAMLFLASIQYLH